MYYAPPPLPPPGSMKVRRARRKSVVPKTSHPESAELSFEVKVWKNDIPIEFAD